MIIFTILFWLFIGFPIIGYTLIGIGNLIAFPFGGAAEETTAEQQGWC